MPAFTMLAMRDWHTALERFGSISLAADTRLIKDPGGKDYVWSVTSSHVEPPALTCLTRYGLQARSFQIFPFFFKDGLLVHHPRDFARPPCIHTFTPNLLTLSFSPWEEVSCQARYWIPDGQAVAGNFKFDNNSRKPLEFQFKLGAILHPHDGGQRMRPASHQGRTILSGRSVDIHPVLLLTGGAQAETSPFPNLSLDVQLPPAGTKRIQWVSPAMNSLERSFQCTQELLAENWRAAQAKVENLWQGQLHITTGDPDWDLAFALTQKTGFSSIRKRGKNGHQFINGRLNPDQPLETVPKGQQSPSQGRLSALQSYYFMRTISPTSTAILKALLDRHLDPFQDGKALQEEGGNPKTPLPFPLLAQMAWEMSGKIGDPEFLKERFPALVAYLDDWFSPKQDRDGDGIPEWSRADQTECHAHPSHFLSPNWYLTPHIQTMESPALCALLVCELNAILSLLDSLELDIPRRRFEAHKSKLLKMIRDSWDPEKCSYQRRDRSTHTSHRGRLLGRGKGPGLIIINHKLENPSRIVLHLTSEKPISPKTKIFLHGKGKTKEHWVENLNSHQIIWHQNHGSLTSSRVYSFLEYVVPYGIHPDVEVEIHTADYQSNDIMLLLPLRSGDPQSQQAHTLIADKVLEGGDYLTEFGLQSGTQPKIPTVLLPWNLLITEALLTHDERALAADLVRRNMDAVIQNLGREKSFYAEYRSDSGEGHGKGYQIGGTAPIGTFLSALGVEIRSQQEVVVEGNNPFPWPVSLSYRGLKITKEEKKTTIIFPDGQETVIQAPVKKVIRWQG